MVIALAMFVRDEEELIAANIRHHLAQGVTHVYVCDNGSVDGTVREMEPFRRRGLVTVEHDPEHRVQQARVLSQLGHRAWDEGAEWVLYADADELLFARDGTVRDALAAVPSDVGVLLVRRYNVVPRPPTSGPWQETMDVRLAQDIHLPGIGEGPLAPKIAHRARAGVQVHQGAHGVVHPALGAASDDGRLHVLHAPLREPQAFAARVRMHGMAYERSRLPIEVGHVRRSLFDSLKDGTLPDRIAAATYDDARIDAGLRSGALVRDLRLVEAMRHTTGRIRRRWRSLSARSGGSGRGRDA